MVELPLKIALFEIVKVGSRVYWTDLGIDFVFLLDTIKRFRTGYYSDAFMSEVVMSPARIRLNYLKTWLFIDVISCIPFSLIILRHQDVSWIRYISLLKLLKLIRLVRVGSMLKQIEQKLKMSIGPFVKQILVLVLVIMFSSHLVACLWLFSSGLTFDDIINYTNESSTTINWVTEEFEGGSPINLYTLYLNSFYWSTTTLTSVGYGDIVARSSKERIIASIACFLGSFLTGFIISSTTAAYGRAYKTTNAFREQMDKIKAYLSYRQVPPKLANRIINYFDYYIARHALFDEQAILQTLSVPLRVELTSFLFEDVLKVIPLFKDINDSSFLSNVMMLLKPLSAAPGDILYRENDIALELYFVVKGSLVGTRANKPSYKVELHVGNHFGEKAVFSKDGKSMVRRSMTVTAKTYCDLFSLLKKDFDAVIEDFPEVRSKLKLQSQKQNYVFNQSALSMTNSGIVSMTFDEKQLEGKVVLDKEEYDRMTKHVEESDAKLLKLKTALEQAMVEFKRYIAANIHTPAAKALLEKYPLDN